MTYETWIGIEIAGIRRGLRLTVGYHIESNRPVLDSVCLRRKKKQLPDSWILEVIGLRQLKELQEEMLRHWESAAAA